MAIQNRRGQSADFVASKMVPGEFAVSQDNRKLYLCFTAGNVKEIAIAEDMANAIAEMNLAMEEWHDEVVEDTEDKVEDAEAWAQGTRGGTPVSSTDPTYQHNAKYYAENIVDNTLSIAGKAADAKKTGDEISDLKDDLNYSKSVIPGYVLSATNNGHGTTWIPSAGAPTDEQVAEAVSDWLDAHPEATTTVEDGSLTEQKFVNDVKAKLNNIVSVRNYGAKGDDSTDDTAAIQRCIDENPHSTIVFPKGIYRISSKLNCYTRVGGTYIFLGGSTIKAISPMETMLDFFDYQTEYKGTEGAPFGVLGGRLDGYKNADACIRNSGVAIRVDNVYMMSFNVCGVKDTGILSNYSKIKCDKARTDEAWSEGTTAGIIAECGDSFFTDVQIQGCHYGVLLRKGGCFFNGCYFFSRTNTSLHPSAPMDGYGIYIDGNMAVTPRTTFNNCYFDSNIYAIYSVATKTWNISLNSCKFFTTDASYFNASKVYLLGGSANVNIRAKGIECYSTATCDMLLGRQRYSIGNNRNFVIDQNKPNVTVNNILNIINLEESSFILGRLAKDTVVLIGAISNANIKNGAYKLTVGYGANTAEFIIKNINDVFTLLDAKRNFTQNYFDIIIDQTPQTADALDTVTYYPIYLRSGINALAGDTHIELKPITFKPASCYLYNDTYRTGSYTLSNPFVIKMYEEDLYSDSVSHSISALNIGDRVKVGSIHSSNTANATMKVGIGMGGSYSEFIFRKVGDAYNLLDANRLSSRNWLNIVIDQTPTVDGTEKDYALYLESRTTNLGGDITISFEPLTPGVSGLFFKADFESGTFTIASPFTLTMYESS